MRDSKEGGNKWALHKWWQFGDRKHFLGWALIKYWPNIQKKNKAHHHQVFPLFLKKVKVLPKGSTLLRQVFAPGIWQGWDPLCKTGSVEISFPLISLLEHRPYARFLVHHLFLNRLSKWLLSAPPFLNRPSKCRSGKPGKEQNWICSSFYSFDLEYSCLVLKMLCFMLAIYFSKAPSLYLMASNTGATFNSCRLWNAALIQYNDSY